MHGADIVRLEDDEADLLLGSSLLVDLHGILNSDVHMGIEADNGALQSGVVVVLEPDFDLPAVHKLK